MAQQEKRKRSVCENCQRPQKLCLCGSINQVRLHRKVTILQSKDEVKHPFNTARLAQLSSDEIEIITSDQINQDLMNNLVAKDSFLLFKNEHSRSISKNNLPKGDMIVLDGTWKKAKGVFFKWPQLSNIPCYHLESDEETIYSSIRKSCGKEHLSTIEAIGVALKNLGDLNEEEYQALISPLRSLIEQQEAFKK